MINLKRQRKQNQLIKGIKLQTITVSNYNIFSAMVDVVLHRGADGLGFSIVGGKDSPKGDLPIYIKTVSGGAAARSGKLKRGDQILSVNGTGLDGFSRQDTVNMLKSLQGQIILTIIPA